MNRSVRLLLPWLDAHEAISALIGFRLPLPGEDLREALATYETQRKAVAKRPPFDRPPARSTPLPDWQQPRADAFLRTMKFDAGTTRTAVVDLADVIAFQKIVALDSIEERTAGISADDADALFDLCIPALKPAEEIDGTFDRDGKGLTISSLNPNLRVSTLQQVPSSNGNGHSDQVVGFSITFGSPHVHVIEYKGRLYLKDGYHRCYALLARGIQRIPCVVATARSFSEVVGQGTANIAHEHLTGARPPLLTDFFDETVSVTLQQRCLRKVVRIHAEEFVAHV